MSRRAQLGVALKAVGALILTMAALLIFGRSMADEPLNAAFLLAWSAAVIVGLASVFGGRVLGKRRGP